MSFYPLAEQSAEFSKLHRSPAFFPLEMDPDGARVCLVRLDEAEYRSASFLDQRIVTPQRQSVWHDWAEVRAASVALPIRTNFIFHIGHVGSTLLSRLLGEHRQVFSVREPALLRMLAEQRGAPSSTSIKGGPPWDEQLAVFLKLLSRTWRPEQTALIKATSFVSAIAGELLARSPSARAVVLFVKPLAYLRGILGGENSRREIASLAPRRQWRFNHAGVVPLGLTPPSSEGEIIAMSWLCEMTSLHLAEKAHPGRMLWLDFDRLLAAPEAGLSKTLTHLETAASNTEVEALAASPWMTRYSKAPEHAYDTALRHSVLAQAARRHAEEIRKGMDWLSRMGAGHAQSREVLEAAARRGS